VERNIDRIERNIDRCARITEQLLSYTRVAVSNRKPTSMDAWVFVGDTMVIDLGGSTDTNRQRIDLDRLGLASDRWYTVRVFLAHRVDGPQDLEISTSIPLTPPRNIVFRMGEHHD